MLYIGYLIILDGQSIKKISFGSSIAFGMSTSQRTAVSNAHLSDELLMGISLGKLNCPNSQKLALFYYEHPKKIGLIPIRVVG